LSSSLAQFTGKHLQYFTKRSHFLDLAQLIGEILQCELAAHHPPGLLLCLLLVHGGFSLFNQADDIAHAEDPRSQATGIVGFQSLQAFTHAQELDRDTGNCADRDGCAASGIAVHLGQDQTGQADRIAKAFCNVQCFLADHCIHHQQDFHQRHALLDRFQLIHQLVIQLGTTGCVDNQHCHSALLG